MEPRRFQDRSEAGLVLAQKLGAYAGRPDVLVLALPRGGVPVAYEVARMLGATLDVFLVRKLGVPGFEELAMGAIATGGVRVLNRSVIEQLQVPEHVVDRVAAVEQRELTRRERLYRGGRPAPDAQGRTVILVDDGLATGSTMQAAIQALRQQKPARVVVAVPTAPPETCQELKGVADDVVCATTPERFGGVGAWYEDFSQTTDDEVRALLDRAGQGPPRDVRQRAETEVRSENVEERGVHVPTASATLEGDLALPKHARGLVLFAHGSGSSRLSPRNRYVARALQDAGLATLLIDLLTPAEEKADERTGHLRFDIGFLAGRLAEVARWLAGISEARDLRLGLFGASTGAGAALVAAAELPDEVGAVVSRGGRPDLAGAALEIVRAPTLLIVGEEDRRVIELNRRAFALLHGEKRIEIVPGATHLFEEPGALEQVARLAREWFESHLPLSSAGRSAR